jgi:hypothetical protein
MVTALVSACSQAEIAQLPPPVTPASVEPGHQGVPIPAPGKWRHEVTMDGRVLPVAEFCNPGGSVISISASKSQTSCSLTRIDSESLRTECTAPDGTSSTTTQTFTGNPESAYTFETTTVFHQADGSGPRSSQMFVKATRLGDC